MPKQRDQSSGRRELEAEQDFRVEPLWAVGPHEVQGGVSVCKAAARRWNQSYEPGEFVRRSTPASPELR